MFQDDPNTIRWKLHLNAPPAQVYHLLNSDAGRAQFWAELAVEKDGAIDFLFPNGWTWRGEILERIPDHKFSLIYYGGSVTTFELQDDGKGGTDVTLTDSNVPPDDRSEVIAGWVSVLMQLKAAVEHKIDLRNHDPERTWDQGFVEN